MNKTQDRLFKRSYRGLVALVLMLAMAGISFFLSGAATMGWATDAPDQRPSFTEINIQPFGVPGVVNESTLQISGRYSWRRNGDVYSPEYIGSSNGTPTPNPEYGTMPYGYLFQVSVPPGYAKKNDQLYVEIFDADSYNRPGTPPPFPPTPRPGTPTPTITITADMYASCNNPRPGVCTSNGGNPVPGLKLNAFESGRPAFWRLDEYRTPYNMPLSPVYDDAYATTTQYTLWHFYPGISDPFGDPALLSDQADYLARYTIKTNQTIPTDLSWYRPPGFVIQLRGGACKDDCFSREVDGSFAFYLYVQGIDGSSGNAFDLRVGPPQTAYDCATPCYVNEQYRLNTPDWVDGGASIAAKRALPLSMNTGDALPVNLAQVSKDDAGETFGVRHFDQDCVVNCGIMRYQMQVCGCPYPTNDDRCWTDVAEGYPGPNDGWINPPHPDPELITIPAIGTPEYELFFGKAGQCPTSGFRIYRNPSFAADHTVWEMPFCPLCDK